jgi:hypothetical protein
MLSAEDHRFAQIALNIDNADGHHFALIWFNACPNPKCRKFSMYTGLAEATRSTVTADRELSVPMAKVPYKKVWRLVPWSTARVFPDYIPQQIRSDYAEACAIRDLSPKASATLARRCLQGMIRDFWKTKKNRLAAAIKAIETKVDSTTWKATDAVRKVGNIGAHMEQDVHAHRNANERLVRGST